MGVAHALNFALQTIAHRVGSYKDKSIRVANKKGAIQTSPGRIHKPSAEPQRLWIRSLDVLNNFRGMSFL
jgi:hypothetical protein